MGGPLLSVVIPVYNVERFLQRAAASVLGQPCAERLELLLVDDGSTDGSGMFCDQIAAGCSSAKTVRVFHKENGGVSSARNLGIQEAHGKYIGFLDADDWWVDAFFDEDLVNLLEERFDVYQFSYLSVSPDRKWYKENRVESREWNELKPEDSRPAPVTHWSCLYRKELLLEHQIRYLPCKINEDVPFVHLAYSMAKSVKTVDRTMLCYWSNPKSCLHSSSAQSSLKEALKSLELEEAEYLKRGRTISNQRVAVSILYTKLPRLCCQTSYRAMQRFLQDPMFDLLRQDEIKPWAGLQSRAALYRRHPLLFWLKARICPGIPLRISKILLAVPPFRQLVYFVQFRLLHRWKPMREAAFSTSHAASDCSSHNKSAS